MAAHRYWRALNIEAYGLAGLELSEFHLLSVTTRVDAAATLTSNFAPTSGALANLQDDVLSTAAGWAAAVVPALVLNWDAGVGGTMDVTDVRLGASADLRKFMQSLRLQYSDDAATWVDQFSVAGVEPPGPRQKTSSLDPTNAWSLTDRARSFSTLSADQLVLGTSAATSGRGLVYKSTGKVQFEVTLTSLATGADFGIGVATSSANVFNYPGAAAGSFAYNRNGNKYLAGSASSYGATFGTGDVIGVVVDFSVGSLTFYKNGVIQGVASATGLLGLSLTPMVGTSSGTTAFSTATLKGSGFTYPVAGASDWSSTPLVRRGLVAGRAAPSQIVSIDTGASFVRPFVATDVMRHGRGRRDYINTNTWAGGNGRVKGSVKDKGSPNVPVQERVRLHRQVDGLLLRETWSAPVTGLYSFDDVDETQAYYVIAFDHDQTFRAVIADNLTLAGGGVELMP